jgi:chromate transporter
MTISLSHQDWLDFFVHFASLSLLGIGGAITTAPDMHRYLVDERNWLTDASFSSSIALAQSAPGPNVLFVALMHPATLLCPNLQSNQMGSSESKPPIGKSL